MNRTLSRIATSHRFRDGCRPFSAAIRGGPRLRAFHPVLLRFHAFALLSTSRDFTPERPTETWRMVLDSNQHNLSVDSGLANLYDSLSVNHPHKLAGHEGFEPPPHRFGDEHAAVTLMAC